MALNAFKSVMPGLMEKLSVTPDRYAVLTILERELSAAAPGARIVGYKGGRVYVEVDSSVHLHEFSFRKGEILKAVRSAAPQGLAPEIKFFLKGTARPTAAERINSRPAQTIINRN